MIQTSSAKHPNIIHFLCKVIAIPTFTEILGILLVGQVRSYYQNTALFSCKDCIIQDESNQNSDLQATIGSKPYHGCMRALIMVIYKARSNGIFSNKIFVQQRPAFTN